MTDAEFTTVCKSMKQDIYDRTPHATGNLRNNATKIESAGYNEMKIFVDEKIAPYFRAVNNRPSYYVKSLYGGKYLKANRNYLYFENAFASAIQNLARRVDGDIIKND